MSEQAYWIWIYGEVALFYDLAEKDKRLKAPILCLRYGHDCPEPAQGVNVSMLMQDLDGYRFPPDIFFEGTAEDARRILRRERNISDAQTLLYRLAFDSDDDLNTPEPTNLYDSLKRLLRDIEEILEQEGMMARLREVKIPEIILKSLEIDSPGTGISRFKTRLASSSAPQATALFFTE